MNVRPPRPCPARGMLAVAGAGERYCRPPCGWSGLGVTRSGVSPRRYSCCNAPFSVAQSLALAVRVGKECRAPHTTVNSHFSDRGRVSLLSGRCGKKPSEGNDEAEVDGTAELCTQMTTWRSSCSGTYCSCRAGPVFISAGHAFPKGLTTP